MQAADRPYVKGSILTLEMRSPDSKSELQLSDRARELRAGILDVREPLTRRVKIIDIFEPSTMSVALIVQLEQEEEQTAPVALTTPAPIMVLKMYDRQFSTQLREFKETGAATRASEDQFIDFVRQGSMPRFLKHIDKNGTWKSGKWDVPKREAYFHVRCTLCHEVELEIYNRLIEMQGVHVPTLFADVRLASTPPQGLDGPANGSSVESLTQYTEVRGILMEYISGFPLNEIVTKTPESDWAPICDQAIEIVRKITDSDFINSDIQTRNILVQRVGEEGEDSSYKVFFLDFAQCKFRDPSDSDEVWRAYKSQRNEEGAVGYVMTTHISRAKGKKGKRYKGPLPLPWEFTPSTRFDGEYIELCAPVEDLLNSLDSEDSKDSED
ncbi:hypothetical protein QQS21_003615 [Conoideocrella luteorostrata]|uniref:Protein kinase domain-containing protein n=1 Tax=Conoideocrella luteorostrata TaxID=1105319 RepID=A0AAJ0G0G5_9HYPO|nr:hypothetical protein QQS21_003615 [Conoideocrella luteorostrata]